MILAAESSRKVSIAVWFIKKKTTNMFKLSGIRSFDVHQRLVDLDIPIRNKVIHLFTISTWSSFRRYEDSHQPDNVRHQAVQDNGDRRQVSQNFR